MNDGALLSRLDTMALLAKVAGGRITRPGTGVMDGYFQDGASIGRLDLAGLADQELISLPISGPPRVAPRGARLLRLHHAAKRATAPETDGR